MNNFKISKLTVIWVLALVFMSCIKGKKESAENQLDNDIETISLGSESDVAENKIESKSTPRLKYFYSTDSRNGMVTERVPFPLDWEQQTSGEYNMTGPNGIKIYGESGKSYVYSNEPTKMQLFQMTGMNFKYPLTMEQTIDEFIIPIANKINRKLVKKYPITPLIEFYKTFNELLFKVEQYPIHYEATALEWVDPDGTRWISVFHYQIEQTPDSVFWRFSTGAMGAPAKYFEAAKQDYLNGLLNRQLNPQWISTMNQQTEYAIRKSNEAHAIRESEFKRGVAERQQQWESNQEVIARRQEHIADVILGNINIIDPETGDRTKIQHTSNRYWVNTQGKYIGTNTTYDDPNKNSYLNGEIWQEFKVDDYIN